MSSLSRVRVDEERRLRLRTATTETQTQKVKNREREEEVVLAMYWMGSLLTTWYVLPPRPPPSFSPHSSSSLLVLIHIPLHVPHPPSSHSTPPSPPKIHQTLPYILSYLLPLHLKITYTFKSHHLVVFRISFDYKSFN